jgi:hypothetical protein
VADAKAYGVAHFAKSLIDVADVLQKALETISPELHKESDVQTLIQGVKATEQNVLKAFKSHGVEPFGKQGDKFDPNRHEALAQVPDPKNPPGSLYQVLRRGWVLNGRVLRPAQVITSIAAPELDKAFLERKVNDKVDESDEIETLKEKIQPPEGGRPAKGITKDPAPEMDKAFLERKVNDRVDEADEIEKLKEKIQSPAGGKTPF